MSGWSLPGREALTEAPPPRRRTRADAEGNRVRIVDAARVAFTADPDATVQGIAKSAGVGQGTIYRHFATREDLLLEVYRRDVQALVDAAQDLLDRHEPIDALRRWFEQLAGYGRIKHGASLAVAAATNAALGTHWYPPVIDALGRLLAACRSTGHLRADIDADGVLLLVSFLWKTDTGPDWADRTHRLLDVVVDGLTTRAQAGPLVSLGGPRR